MSDSIDIKCWICGKPATLTKPIFDNGCWKEIKPTKYRRCYCDKCYKEHEKKESEDRKLYIKLRKQEMFRKAVKILESQHTDMYEYKEAIEVVQEFVENNPEKIDSSYEALTAIILVHNRIHSKMQHKVNTYQVDFLLPDLMVVLEIDGERHKGKKEEDKKRDHIIKTDLGPGWEVVRITTDMLDKNAKKLPEAIYKVIDYRLTEDIHQKAFASDVILQARKHKNTK